MLIDHAARQQATDPRHSFIVQAPAGSGKTEILTQRYLRLLSAVQAPEQIIALTFTRKAANEMRERILLALQRAAGDFTPTSPHQITTHQFATAALAHATQLQWNLLQQPQRLRIITLDALCQLLTQAIPSSEQSLHYARVSDKPHGLYVTAARACLEFVLAEPNYHPAITTLLHHVDNRQDYLIALWASMLSNRDQWLDILFQARQQEQSTYEQALTKIQQHALHRLQQALPKVSLDRLMTLLQQFLDKIAPESWLCLRDLTNLHSLTHTQSNALCNLLLTGQGTIRKAFDHHVGLKRGACRDEDYVLLKTESKELLGELSELPDFVAALLRVQKLPEPVYDADQWQALQSLFTLLPLLVAHLNIAMQEAQCVDFTAISQSALQALGSEDAPTDLALYLDNTIQHLLIDEFQDTSFHQFHLLERIVHGWEEHDGRTVFVVGDPMQSIYRFRGAEVGLFLRTKTQGIGPVRLTSLELRCNFRSTAAIVNWVNNQFQTIFPAKHDIESGAVAFHASNVVDTTVDSATSFIQAWHCLSAMHEAETIVECVRHELAKNPQTSIAILVRSRGQLREIIQVLRQTNISFQGIDIDLLANLPHIRDIWALTQALLMPGHRLAWLTFLRSPWVGLTLADLHCVANYAKRRSVYYALQEIEKINDLSEDGHIRLRFVTAVLKRALTERHQYPLVNWILRTLHALKAELILTSAQHSDLEQFWLLLEQFAHAGQLNDLALFETELSKLYAQQVTPSRLQIMTIHKSKGLEFDCVILPSLSTKTAALDTTLLRWCKLPTAEDELFLMSPLKAAQQTICPLYDYLGRLQQEKNFYENQRLLYVATTRAKKRLYLFDQTDTARSGSFRALLAQQQFVAAPIRPEVNVTAQKSLLWRLPLVHYNLPGLISSAITNESSALSLTLNNTARVLGIVAHELLQWICTYHPSDIDTLPWALARQRLKSHGLNPHEQEESLTKLNTWFRQLYHNHHGQWLIQSHNQERNEYALLIKQDNTIHTRIIDRTFIHAGKRWIIDFKTGTEDKHSLHEKQVNEYANLLHPQSNEPIWCGLYYLETGNWHTWAFNGHKISQDAPNMAFP